MKTAYIDTLTELMRQDENLVTITADMGFSVYEALQQEFPDRFINTGVTEQATMSFAAGMALTGFKVFVYAQGIFASTRCFEQVRLDIAYNKANVKIIGVNSGFSLNQLGTSHFALEDVALMRALPGITIFTPGDPVEMRWAVRKAYEIDGPTYLRYTKKGNTIIHKDDKGLEVGAPIKISRDDVTLFVSGGLLETANKVVLELKKQNISTALYSAPTVKPLDERKYLEILRQSKYIFTLEEHSIVGGFGSAIAELISEYNIHVPFKRLGAPDEFTSITGSIDYLHDYNNISDDKLTKTIASLVSQNEK